MLFLFCLLLFFSCSTTWKNKPERVLYSSKNVELIGKDAGLPDYIKNIRLNLTNLIEYEREFFTPFKLKLEFYFESYGLRLKEYEGDETNFASLFVSIDSINAKESTEITNIYNLLYTLELSFSLLDNSRNYLQKDKTIKEYVLVFDTNRYNNEAVLLYLSDLSARHLAERVKFGWQSDYSKTDDKVIILGGKVETTNRTNRTK
ncbi:MAG: hypothetical protein ACP5QT_01185 [Brevinematia bacterium]